MKRFEIEILDKKQIEALSRKELMHNEYICETAGFEPLEVRMKRFEQNGIIRNAFHGDVTSADLREMYLNPDYSLSPEDDIDDIKEKMQLLQAHINEVKQKVAQRSKPAETTASAGSQAVSAAENTESEKKSEE